MLYFANILTFGELQNEIEEIIFSDTLNFPLTYPTIQPELIAEAHIRGYC